MCRRSSRKKAKKTKLDRSQLRAGYAAFRAVETKDTKSGTQDTTATLSVSGISYVGSSKSPGHAEMDALNDILIGNGDSLDDVIAHDNKTVSCTAKPCCFKCSIVLGLLGFGPASGATLKTRSGMGGTQWVLQSPLKEKIEERYGDIVDYFYNIPNFNGV